MATQTAKNIVYLGMSGGVDSSVAAHLLVAHGYEVIGVYMKNWTDQSVLRTQCTTWQEDRGDALKVAAKLGIPFETWDFESEYNDKVMNYFFNEYHEGRTPNPDIMCNKEIKFGVFYNKARERGADFIATGHYARIVNDEHGSHLVSSHDTHKDQTYFLSRVHKELFPHILFPIGEYEKKEVRSIAREQGFSTAEKKDSQGICFVGNVDMRSFLQQRLPITQGNIRTTEGDIVGTHEGSSFYTIGQRKGMGVGGGLPYYIVEKNTHTNELIVAKGNTDPRLFTKEVTLKDVEWNIQPTYPLRVYARLRYLQPLTDVEVGLEGPSDIHLHCDTPQRAVTPGQIAVLYGRYKDGFEVLGSGVIV